MTEQCPVNHVRARGGAVDKILKDRSGMPLEARWRTRVILFATVCVGSRLAFAYGAFALANADLEDAQRVRNQVLEVTVLAILLAGAAAWAIKEHGDAGQEGVWWSRTAHATFYFTAATLWLVGGSTRRTQDEDASWGRSLQKVASGVLVADVAFGICHLTAKYLECKYKQPGS